MIPSVLGPVITIPQMIPSLLGPIITIPRMIPSLLGPVQSSSSCIFLFKIRLGAKPQVMTWDSFVFLPLHLAYDLLRSLIKIVSIDRRV